VTSFQTVSCAVMRTVRAMSFCWYAAAASGCIFPPRIGLGIIRNERIRDSVGNRPEAGRPGNSENFRQEPGMTVLLVMAG
jgi:hypothetical protein